MAGAGTESRSDAQLACSSSDDLRCDCAHPGGREEQGHPGEPHTCLNLAMGFGRTSCNAFWANQLRVTLNAAAFVLLQELQLRADGTALAVAQVSRLRHALLTIGVQVVRRIVLHFPRPHPAHDVWIHVARTISARSRRSGSHVRTPSGTQRAGGVPPHTRQTPSRAAFWPYRRPPCEYLPS